MKGIACDRRVATWVFSQGSGCQVCPGLGRLAAGVPVAVCGKWFLGSGDFGAWEEVMKLMMFDDV